MSTPEPVAVVAATAGELQPLLDRLSSPAPHDVAGLDQLHTGRLEGRDVVLAACGIGTVAAATSVATLAHRFEPSAVVMTGIAGAYVGAFVPVGVAVAAASETDLDAGILGADGRTSLEVAGLARGDGPAGPIFDRIDLDPTWRDALADACNAVPLPFATSDAVSGDLDVAAARAERSAASIESMEGFGVALACARLGLPFGEVRGVSNVAGVRDKAAWNVPAAVRAATGAVLSALRDGP